MPTFPPYARCIRTTCSCRFSGFSSYRKSMMWCRRSSLFFLPLVVAGAVRLPAQRRQVPRHVRPLAATTPLDLMRCLDVVSTFVSSDHHEMVAPQTQATQLFCSACEPLCTHPWFPEIGTFEPAPPAATPCPPGISLLSHQNFSPAEAYIGCSRGASAQTFSVLLWQPPSKDLVFVDLCFVQRPRTELHLEAPGSRR